MFLWVRVHFYFFFSSFYSYLAHKKNTDGSEYSWMHTLGQDELVFDAHNPPTETNFKSLFGICSV